MEQEAIRVEGGATVNGVQTDTEVIMARKGFDKWPSALIGLKEWEDKVRQQDAVDHEINLYDVVMSPVNGGFYKVGKSEPSALPGTKTAISHFMSYVKSKESNALANLLDMPLAIRSQMFAEYTHRQANRSVVLRTALASPECRVIRAVVSDKHSQQAGDDLKVIESLRDLAKSLPDSAKLRVIRQWDSTHAELVLPNVVVQPKVGVTLYGRISIINSETKGGSYTTEGGSFNLVCLNGMVRPGNTSEYRVRHMGDISYRVRQSIRGAVEAVSEHLHVFSQAYETPLGRPRADILEAFGSKNELPSLTIHAINTLWDVDGDRSAGDTLAGLVNAVTRHAQNLNVEQAIKMEQLAGETLHNGLGGFI